MDSAKPLELSLESPPCSSHATEMTSKDHYCRFVYMHTCGCGSFHIGCSRTPFCHQRHQLFSALPQPLLTHTFLEAYGLVVLIPYLFTTSHTQTCTRFLTQHPVCTSQQGVSCSPKI